MSGSVKIFVRGLPAPQGSARAFVRGGRAFVATDGNRLTSPLGAWRAAVRNEAQRAMAGRPVFQAPTNIRVAFGLPRPRSLPARVTWPDVKPDIDKLARAVLDGLTGVVIADDARVVVLELWKFYDDDRPGATITVREMGGGRNEPQAEAVVAA